MATEPAADRSLIRPRYAIKTFSLGRFWRYWLWDPWENGWSYCGTFSEAVSRMDRRIARRRRR